MSARNKLNFATHTLKDLDEVIKKASGIELKPEKMSLVENRLSRRMTELGLSDLKDYVSVIKNDSREKQICIELLTTHHTHWFREIAHFQWLHQQALVHQKANKVLKVWSAACSTGEEVYSILFLLLKAGLKPQEFQILATDISEKALTKAQQLPQEFKFRSQLQNLKKHWNPVHFDEYIETALQSSIKWRPFNLIKSELPSGLKFDVIFLRNVLIYFDRPTVIQVCQNLTRYLKSGGHLVLGHSESLGHEVKNLDLTKNSIYQYQSKNKPVGSNHVTTKKTKVLIVEDSIPIQKILSRAYSHIEGVEVVSIADNAEQAIKDFFAFEPDFVSLDLKLKTGTGLDFLKAVHSKPHKHFRCALITDCEKNEGNLVLEALEMGVATYIQKPQAQSIDQFSRDLKELVTGLFERKQNKMKSRRDSISLRLDDYDLVAIGSSTGGTEIVRDLIRGFPLNSPPILVVQHMPSQFTSLFAERISKQSGRTCHEVKGRMPLQRGSAYIAAGGFHSVVEKRGAQLFVSPDEGAPVNRFKPSVSVLFSSIHKTGLSPKTLALMLTGMGRDGAKEMKILKDAGAMTIGQSEESCTVYGMPRAAAEEGALVESLSPGEIIELVNKGLLKNAA